MRLLALILLAVGCAAEVDLTPQALVDDEEGVQVIHRPGWPLGKPLPTYSLPDGGADASPLPCEIQNWVQGQPPIGLGECKGGVPVTGPVTTKPALSDAGTP